MSVCPRFNISLNDSKKQPFEGAGIYKIYYYQKLGLRETWQKNGKQIGLTLGFQFEAASSPLELESREKDMNPGYEYSRKMVKMQNCKTNVEP